jgi:hypothetical protein
MSSPLVSRPAVLAVAAALAAIGAAGCGQAAKSANPGAPEVNPAGDIPDNQAYVRYAPPGGGFSVTVPEGWSRTAAGGAVTFTDKLNSVRLETAPAQAAPTVAAVRRTELPKLAASIKGFRPSAIGIVARKAGSAVRIAYLAAAAPNAVTGKAGQDAVERYVFFHKGRDVILTLSGPKGADNVDPWKIITDSVRWSR